MQERELTMGVEYKDPEDYDEETASSSEVEDECPWKKTFYEEGDHHADDVDYVPDDIL